MARGGPRTVGGKAVVSLNAVRHGITSARVTIPGLEREEDWIALRESLIEALAPVGALEEDLAEHVAATAWRRRRIPHHEAQMIAVGLERVPQEFAKLAAWRDAPRTGEEARGALDRTRAAAALLERLDALPERRRLDAGACHELVDAACASDDDVLADLPGMPPPEHLSSGELWDAARLRAVLGEVAARLSIGLPELIAATAARLGDGISRRERDLAYTDDELDRMNRERSLPGAKELKSIAATRPISTGSTTVPSTSCRSCRRAVAVTRRSGPRSRCTASPARKHENYETNSPDHPRHGWGGSAAGRGGVCVEPTTDPQPRVADG